MRYLGGKRRINGWVANIILEQSEGRQVALEPFIGSAAVTVKLCHRFKTYIASDAHPDLVMMWNAAIQRSPFPGSIDKEVYAKFRSAEPSPMRGLVGFGASWGGKWFGGYAGSVWDKHHQKYTKDYYQTALRSVLSDAHVLRSAGVRVLHKQYSDWRPGSGVVVYCDPPYSATTGYAGATFNSRDFWEWARQRSLAGATVLVSEYTAPSGWHCVAQRQRKHMLRVVQGEEQNVATEKVFRWSPRLSKVKAL